MCKILKLENSLQIRGKKSNETKVLQIVIRVPPWGSFHKGWGCEVLSRWVNIFFLPYFKLRTIFSGYGVIRKGENNFSDRTNDPVSKGEKSSYVNIYGIWVQNSPEAKVKKIRNFTNNMCKILNLERSLKIRRKWSKETKVFQIVIRVPPWGSFHKGCGCEVFSTRVNVFFLPYFKLRTILSG